MRWIVLALSLGSAIMSVIHGVIAMWLSPGQGAVVSGNAFTWVTGALLLLSALLASIGGILAVNKRRAGGFFLVVAALVCLFAHRDTRIYGGIYLVGGLLAFVVRPSSEYEDYEYDEDEEDDDDYYEEDEDELRDKEDD